MKTIPASQSCLALFLCLLASATAGFGQAFSWTDISPYAAKITVRTDIAYGAGEQQKLDLYLPVGVESPPVVICWYGGAFYGGDKGYIAGACAFLAAHGFAAVAPNYFLGTRDGARSSWPYSVHDAKAAVRFVRAHAKELQVDPSRIVALGHSSGAYLATMVGFTPNLPELEGPGGDLTESSRVSAVVAMSGVYDRRRMLGLPLGLLGQGYEEKPDLQVATSPIIYVSPATVPVYILHGDHDHIADVSSARQLDAALTAANVPHQLRIVDADHDPFARAKGWGHEDTVDELAAIVAWLQGVVATPQPVKTNLQLSLNYALSQSDMSLAAENLAQHWDRELENAEQNILDSVDAGQAALFKKSQEQWRKFREAEVELQGHAFEGGTIQPLIHRTTYARLTERRVKELRAHPPSK